MFISVVCLTCQLPLGNVAEIYRHIRKKRLAKLHGQRRAPGPEFALIRAGNVQAPMGDVLDALRLDDCCRGRMVAHVDFRDRY